MDRVLYIAGAISALAAAAAIVWAMLRWAKRITDGALCGNSFITKIYKEVQTREVLS